MRDQLPHLKAIVQYKGKLSQDYENTYDVSVVLRILFNAGHFEMKGGRGTSARKAKTPHHHSLNTALVYQRKLFCIYSY